MRTHRVLGPLVPLLFAACGGGPAARAPSSPATSSAAGVTPTAPSETAPTFRLPAGVKPVEEHLVLSVDPAKARFSGEAEIVVATDAPHRVLWLHGNGLHVTSAQVTPDGGAPIAATWAQASDHGLAELTLASDLPAGRATMHIAYDAAFIDGRKGLYKVTEGGAPYAVTQFEAIEARDAFPCFDEPGFKVPFQLTLVVPDGQTVFTNSPEVGREPADGGAVRVRFAATPPLPSYLVAFGVGPWDVVDAPPVPPNAARPKPLPLRVLVPHGRAAEAAYTRAHAGDILSTLEGYFGIAYPYEKLDLIATADKGGAMENAGAVTFDESLLLFDEKTAPLGQRQGFAYVTAHELAHMWFGDLVTMAWWDDTWLNESFATWMGAKAADTWDPASDARLNLLDGIQGAIGTDSLVSARSIHQPIASEDDIENSFDETTYQKGGGVLGMFEHFLGEQTFRDGVRLHLTQHRFGNATADDFLSALSTAAKTDVATAFKTFLDQPGVPYVEASVQCGAGGAAHLHVAQSRFLPRGSSGDPKKLWGVPVCTRYEVSGKIHESCSLVTADQADVPLDGGACPAWVFPNTDAAGYYRFSLDAPDLAKLRDAGLAKLSSREKVAFGNSIRAGYNHGTTAFADALRAAAPLADDSNATVANEPAGMVGDAYEWLYDDPVRPAIEAYARKLYAKQYARLGFTRGKSDDNQAVEMRRFVVRFLAFTGRDPAVRAEAKKRALAYIGWGKDGAIHPDAVDTDLAGTSLAVLGEEATKDQWEAMLALFAKSDDEILRQRLLGALSLAKDPALAARARDLALDPRVRVIESLTPVFEQLGAHETREAEWTWLKEHWDAYIARLAGTTHIGPAAIGTVATFCDEAHAADAASFFQERAKSIEGGPRTLAKQLERVHLCVAKRTGEQEHAKAFFSGW